MTEENKLKAGDRVRIVSGTWASDCGTVVSVTRGFVRVRVDTPPNHVAIVRLSDVERVE